MTFARDVLRTGVCRYFVTAFKGKNTFDILYDISSDVTLCQLVDSRLNDSHAVTVCDNWIFDANLEYALPLCQASLNSCLSVASPYHVEFRSVKQAYRFKPPKQVGLLKQG